MLTHKTLFYWRFNSQPPEGGWKFSRGAMLGDKKFQLTAARRRLAQKAKRIEAVKKFQLTAARRRLGALATWRIEENRFQLTAARRRLGRKSMFRAATGRFNSQPPEGGWAM